LEGDPRRVSAIPTVSRYSFPGQFTMNLSRGKFLGRMAQAVSADSCDWSCQECPPLRYHCNPRKNLGFQSIELHDIIHPERTRWKTYRLFGLNMFLTCIMTGLKLHYDILWL
jgi:hypothetical protein